MTCRGTSGGARVLNWYRKCPELAGSRSLSAFRQDRFGEFSQLTGCLPGAIEQQTRCAAFVVVTSEARCPCCRDGLDVKVQFQEEGLEPEREIIKVGHELSRDVRLAVRPTGAGWGGMTTKIEVWWPLLDEPIRAWVVNNLLTPLAPYTLQEIERVGGPTIDDPYWRLCTTDGRSLPPEAIQFIVQSADFKALGKPHEPDPRSAYFRRSWPHH